MPYCTGTTPGKTPGYNYEHACKLEAGHDGDCLCIGCGRTFTSNPPLRKAAVRVVPPEEIDPARSLLAKDYMRWNGSGPSSLKKRCKACSGTGRLPVQGSPAVGVFTPNPRCGECGGSGEAK